MRHTILTLLLIPSMLQCSGPPPSLAGGGRGFLIPPTIHEMAETQCLATMIYGEARGESKVGQIAVAYSAINRTKGKRSVCSVVLAPKQYSVFNGNTQLKKVALGIISKPRVANSIDKAAWEKAERVARLVINKAIPDPTKGSTHYVAPKAMAAFGYTYPKWTFQYTLTTIIDNHKFYKPFYPGKKQTDT